MRIPKTPSARASDLKPSALGRQGLISHHRVSFFMLTATKPHVVFETFKKLFASMRAKQVQLPILTREELMGDTFLKLTAGLGDRRYTPAKEVMLIEGTKLPMKAIVIDHAIYVLTAEGDMIILDPNNYDFKPIADEKRLDAIQAVLARHSWQPATHR